eukprot:6178775-Pleurochrysis_carterae.AAC.3
MKTLFGRSLHTSGDYVAHCFNSIRRCRVEAPWPKLLCHIYTQDTRCALPYFAQIQSAWACAVWSQIMARHLTLRSTFPAGTVSSGNAARLLAGAALSFVAGTAGCANCAAGLASGYARIYSKADALFDENRSY